MTTQINATLDSGLAQGLSEIGDLGQGTLVSLILRKKGCERKGLIYGDDFTHVLLWTGFHYKALVERSDAKLKAMWAEGTFLTDILQAVHATGHTGATIQDVSLAVQELQGNFHRVLSDKDPMAGADVEGISLPYDELTTKDCVLGGSACCDPERLVSTPVFEPLKIDGKTIVGAKVYVGTGSKDPRAAVPGTVYIDGVKLGERILEPGANGSWVPKQLAKTVAKEIIRGRLPVGLYVRYALTKENLLTFKVGKEASAHAKEGGVSIDPEAIRSLFRIAP